MGCITVFRNVQQKGKKTRKKRKTKTPQKIWHTSICRFFKNIYFSVFPFLSNLSWIVHHSGQKCTTKGKKTRKKRKTKNPLKNSAYYMSIFKEYIFFFFSFFLRNS